MTNSDKSHCDPRLIQQVRDSYTRSQNNANFFDIFYKNLLGKSEEIKAKFAELGNDNNIGLAGVINYSHDLHLSKKKKILLLLQI